MTKARLTLAAFWILFGVFVLNVLLGKAAISFGWLTRPTSNNLTPDS